MTISETLDKETRLTIAQSALRARRQGNAQLTHAYLQQLTRARFATVSDSELDSALDFLDSEPTVIL